MIYDRARAQSNVTAATRRTEAAIASGRARLSDPAVTGESRKILCATIASHENHLTECRDAQAALNDGDNPEGWA